uniref:Uncharacterized protein n=3 Tax=Ditylum brightwellii TaxID=49249 RepID=A0A7S4VV48_9STRA|mmetsp:Transcript_4919/g.6466  ORF Transcript_4919/g.6466 Transcript_4919/m.6466 type:complete len:425 (-) Transcript_4919:337-1611(-)
MKTEIKRWSCSITVSALCLFFLLSTATARQSSSSLAKRLSLGNRSTNKLAESLSNASRIQTRNFPWGCTSLTLTDRIINANDQLLISLRGGSSDTEDEETDSEEYDSEEESEEEEEEEQSDEEESVVEESDYDSDESEYDDEYDEEEDEEAESSLAKSVKSKAKGSGEDFDEPLVPSSMQSMSMTIGIMVACRRIDLFDPKVVRIARFVFIAYAIITQLFLAFVRIKARKINDRTPITLSNPLSSVVQSQLSKGGSGGTNDMVKNLAGQFLSSQTTVMEYDLKQAKSMSNSLLFPLAFNWFLHFKMNQVQPLLFQTANGISNLIYSPLFQVYVLGRNLERPFKSANPMAEKVEAMKKQQQEEEEAKKKSTVEEEGASVNDDETEGSEYDVTEQSEEEDSAESDNDDDSSEDEEYDGDEYDEEDS